MCREDWAQGCGLLGFVSHFRDAICVFSSAHGFSCASAVRCRGTANCTDYYEATRYVVVNLVSVNGCSQQMSSRWPSERSPRRPDCTSTRCSCIQAGIRERAGVRILRSSRLESGHPRRSRIGLPPNRARLTARGQSLDPACKICHRRSHYQAVERAHRSRPLLGALDRIAGGAGRAEQQFHHPPTARSVDAARRVADCPPVPRLNRRGDKQQARPRLELSSLPPPTRSSWRGPKRTSPRQPPAADYCTKDASRDRSTRRRRARTGPPTRTSSAASARAARRRRSRCWPPRCRRSSSWCWMCPPPR
jgi:hypothetical protein